MSVSLISFELCILTLYWSSHNGYIDRKKQNKDLYTPKYVVVIIFIQSLPRGDLRRLPCKGGVIKANIEQANLQPIVAD